MSVIYLQDEKVITKIINHINIANDFKNPVEKCGKLFEALDIIHYYYYEFRKNLNQLSINEKHDNFFDREAYIQLMLKDFTKEEKKEIIFSDDFRNFLTFRPLIMDNEIVAKLTYNKTKVSDEEIQVQSNWVHKSLIDEYEKFKRREDSTDKIISKFSKLIYVVRCNIKHHGKYPYGPIKIEADRDNAVCKLVNNILLKILNILLGYPDKKVAVYGTLKKNGVNHSIIEKYNISPEMGHVKGYIEIKENLPYFIWDLDGEKIEVEMYHSLSEENFAELDKFESLYVRILIPVYINKNIVISNIYSVNPESNNYS